MARILAALSSLLFLITMSACTKGIDAQDAVLPQPVPSVNSLAQNTQAKAFVAPKTPVPIQTPVQILPENTPLPTPQSTAITIKPEDSSGRVIIVYPKCEINNALTSESKNYTLLLTPGDYSDPDNAISTFLFDLYMKQSLCYENIHEYVSTDKENLPFMRNLNLMESMILNLGQIDVLVLPKMEYYEDGSPYIYRNSAAYKAPDEDVIRFGSLTEKEAYRQVAKGVFNPAAETLYFEVNTQKEDMPPSTTYFEALRTKAGYYLYRCVNTYGGRLQSVYVSVSPRDLMEAGFSEGKLPKDYKFTPLKKTTSMQESDKQNGLKQSLYLFASADGAVIKPVEEEPEDATEKEGSPEQNEE